MNKNNMEEIKKIKYRINQNNKELIRIKNNFYKANRPADYKEGSSYEDYNTIRGSRKDNSLMNFYSQIKRIETMIELDKEVLRSLNIKTLEVNEEEYLRQLETREQKVKFLRYVKCYKQYEVAEILDLSIRQVQRLLAKEKKKKCKQDYIL